MLTEINSYLVQLLQNLQTDSNEQVFAYVYDNLPKGEHFEGYPYAIILPTRSPGDYSTTAQNDRRESFTIEIGIPLEGEGYDRQSAFNIMRQIVDVTKNAIDATQDLDGLSSADNKSIVLGVLPVSAGWDISESGAGETLVADIEVIVRYSHTFI